jgi:hypothetical protein
VNESMDELYWKLSLNIYIRDSMFSLFFESLNFFRIGRKSYVFVISHSC